MAKKKIEMVTPVYQTSFSIPQLPKYIGIMTKKKEEKSPFISPIFGDSVTDIVTLPYKIKREGDYDKQYDAFREEKLTDEEKIKKFGKKYYEFTNIVTKEQRESFYGKDIRRTSTIIQTETQERQSPVAVEENVVIEPKDTSYAPVYMAPEIEGDFKVRTYEASDLIVEDVVEEEKIIPHVKASVAKGAPLLEKTYVMPSPKMFSKKERSQDEKPAWLLEQIVVINDTLKEFGIEAEVKNSKKGPTVTRYEIEVNAGVNVKKFGTIQETLMMRLAATTLRIEAPIPGKPFVGIEVPNEKPEIVAFGNVVDQKVFLEDHDHPLKVALGVDIDGENIYVDISKMPHGLIAGATNSGKSVCVNTILISLLIKNKPEDLRLILIDPKMVELSTYNDLPHLVTPVITDAKMASSALTWAVEEMEKRYQKFAQGRVRDIKAFNESIESKRIEDEKMPYLLIVIDELADLMMVSAHDVEYAIQRLTQKARAAGIHLLVATQRPTTDVVKGTIKSNIPTRIAFKVSSFVDSTTILDGAGAEMLLGKGDMLLKENDGIKRLQGAFISSDEIDQVTDFIRAHSTPNYIFEHEKLVMQVKRQEEKLDDLFENIARFVVQEKNASINRITVEFNIGFNRAKAIVESLITYGIVSGEQGTKAKEVLVDESELDAILGSL